jgi:molybdenum cofactor cytidylyltransferase
MSDIGLILLAAGGSTRMGKPKQLLAYQGSTLLRRATDTAIASGCAPVVVVVGAAADGAARELDGVTTALLEMNPDWERGMGTSIRAGLRRVLRERPDIAAVLIMLCDQPHVDAAHLRHLCDVHHSTAKRIVASGYGGALGPPCLFAAESFEDLLQIGDGEGAKRLINLAGDDRATVPLPAAAVDIDTPEDYDRLKPVPSPGAPEEG